MSSWFWNHLPEGVILGLLAIARYLGLRAINRIDNIADKHEERLRNLETNHITHDDFDELRSSMTASMTNMSNRLERSLDRMHGQNTGTLDRINTRVDDLWKIRTNSGRKSDEH